MSNNEISIRQTDDRIIFRAMKSDKKGISITSGEMELRVHELQDDGTLKVYDWSLDCFVSVGIGVPDCKITMSQQRFRDHEGKDEDTGIWTKVLQNLSQFVEGNVYMVQVLHPNGHPNTSMQEFEFSGVSKHRVPAVSNQGLVTMPHAIAVGASQSGLVSDMTGASLPELVESVRVMQQELNTAIDTVRVEQQNTGVMVASIQEVQAPPSFIHVRGFDSATGCRRC